MNLDAMLVRDKIKLEIPAGYDPAVVSKWVDPTDVIINQWTTDDNYCVFYKRGETFYFMRFFLGTLKQTYASQDWRGDILYVVNYFGRMMHRQFNPDFID